MGTLTIPNSFSNGTTIDAAQVNADFSAVAGVVNGQIDATNIAAAGVTKVKLATDSLNNFLKLATSADRKVAFGTAAISWAGGVDTSDLLTVAHGLGAAPLFFVFFMFDQSGSGACFAAGNTKDATNITAFFKTIAGFLPTAGSNGTAGWLAIT